MSPCPSSEQLRQLLADDLSAVERQRIESHVEGCAACQEMLEELNGEPTFRGALPEGYPEDWSRHEPDSALLRQLREVQASPAAGRGGEQTVHAPGGGAVSSCAENWPRIPGYEVLGVLGRGGMAVVYHARHRALNRPVALKMIQTSAPTDAVALARFRTEAEAIARLQHPHVVQIYEVGEHDGLPYLALEFVAGGSLANKIEGTPLPARQAAQLVAVSAGAIHAAHQRGLIHRDLKPANVLLTAEGTPKVSDFGLAKLTDGGSGPTATGEVLGTPSYMAPEQAEGKGWAVGPATDVYALGAILYELLTGRPPFRAATALETLRQVVQEEPVPPRRINRAIPAELETIVGKAMEKTPADRYATAQELADDLRRFQEDKSIWAKRATWWHRLRKWSRRNKPVVWTTGGALIVLLILALIGSLVSVSFVTEQRDRALKSEATAKQRLGDSLFAQAQAGRWSGLAGQHFASLEALGEATRMARELGAQEKDILKLRNEAIACMCLPDLRRLPEYDRYTAEETGGVLDSQLQRYAIMDDRGDIIIRQIPTDQEVVRLQEFGVRASSMEFSPNGRFLAAVYPRDAEGKRGQAFVWDISLREIILRLPSEFVDPGLLWSPDSRRLAVHYSSPSRAITLWDVDANKEIQRFSTQPLYDIAFDPSGKHLAILLREGWVQIHDVDTGGMLDRFRFPVAVKRIAWGCGGRFLAGSYAEPRIEVKGWAIYRWDVPARQMKVLEGHRNTPVHLAFNHAGNLLASNGWDGTIRLWNPWTGKEVLRTEGDWGSLRFSPDDRFLQVGAGWSKVRHCWEVRAGHEFRQLFTPVETTFSWANIRFSPDGRLLAAECNDGARLWDVTSGKHVAWLSPDRTDTFGFDPSGKYFVTRGPVGNYRWPLALAENQVERKLRIGPPEKIPAEDPTTVRRDGRLASPDGKWLVYSSDKGVRIWDARSGKLVRDLTATRGKVFLLFSPDGKWLVTGSDDGYFFWQVDSWTLHYQLPRGEAGGLPTSATFSLDSKLAALYQSVWEIQLIHLATGRVIATLPNLEPCPLETFAFSPDGTQLAATTRTQSIHLWDLRAIRKQLRTMDLDWDLEPYPARSPIQDTRPLEIQADLGHMINKEKYSLIIAFFPFHAEAYYQRGLAHARSVQWQEAIDDFSMALALKPDHAEAYYARELIRSHPELGGAVVAIDSALAPGPTDDARTHNNLAWLLATCPEPKFRNPSRAVELAKTAVELAPQASIVRNTLGVAHYRTGNWKEAIEKLEKAEALAPGTFMAWNAFFLSMAHWQLGDKEKARQWYMQAVSWMEKNRPNDEELLRFRDEAEELLQMPETKPHPNDPEDTKKPN
jgi:serine/threonine protein kinase/WD40 repeat protein